MTQTNDTRRGGHPSGVRRRGAGRIATQRTRMRVSSDAVVSAYIRDIARPHTGGEQPDPQPRHHPATVEHGYDTPRRWRGRILSHSRHERRIPSNDRAGGDDADCKNHSER